jgi:hypothetical protein
MGYNIAIMTPTQPAPISGAHGAPARARGRERGDGKRPQGLKFPQPRHAGGAHAWFALPNLKE